MTASPWLVAVGDRSRIGAAPGLHQTGPVHDRVNLEPQTGAAVDVITVRSNKNAIIATTTPRIVRTVRNKLRPMFLTATDVSVTAALPC